jgi:hypothetical protein
MERVFQQLEASYQQYREPNKDWKKYFQSVQKRNKHYLSKIWDWVNEQGWFDPPIAQKEGQIYRFYKKVEGKVPLNDLRITRRTYKGADSSTLASSRNRKAQTGIFALGKVRGDVIGPDLQTQLDDFRAFMINGGMSGDRLKEISAGENFSKVLQVLGWFHRIEGVAVDDLCLETLVPFVKLRLNLEQPEDTEKWATKSWLAREQAKQLATQMELSVRKYLNWSDSRIPDNPSLHPQSKMSIVTAWLAVAKYIYRLETDLDESNNFNDIPAVRRLRKLNRELTKQARKIPNVVDHDLKMVPWPFG